MSQRRTRDLLRAFTIKRRMQVCSGLSDRNSPFRQPIFAKNR
ncbi:hypothetical protein NEIMUCOT_05679 [Neisseria mucosa ATCC 25996]|uniref:Uncharacterized protein n=1 Tax=Neisseria mucosa (strain ATCC 25996 / DSM 4631 / NCTC 10774 / M26) TaxID=546266 RepID=D2ZYH0_NEIM2|nr:hypothetical protein NEIMUCOT_05679 [Neisseria mucosa ATCC 25996]